MSRKITKKMKKQENEKIAKILGTFLFFKEKLEKRNLKHKIDYYRAMEIADILGMEIDEINKRIYAPELKNYDLYSYHHKPYNHKPRK